MQINMILKTIVFISIMISIIAIFYININQEKRIKKGVVAIILAIFLMVPFFLIRAYIIKFFPFTNKVESFITLYAMISLVSVFFIDKFESREIITFLIFGILSAISALLFKDNLRFPSPALRTIWFPLHVPLSFLAYAFWIAAGVKSFFISINKEEDSEIILKFNRYGFMAFSLSMIFGGIWGYFAWGAYFMWDPKILWSAILWIYYGNLLHIDMIPSYKKYKHVLYVFGIIIIIITFIGTGFFSRSIHRF